MSAGKKWLSVIGIEENGLAGLTDEALGLVQEADVIFGGTRHLAMLDDQGGEKILWQSPFANSFKEIDSRRGKNVVVLATGDPQWFGVGNVLCQKFSIDEMTIIPARSVFSLAAGKIGWSLSKVQALTVHGREFSSLTRYVLPGAQLLILTADGTTPKQIAAHLDKCGFGESRLWVMEHLGGQQERIRQTNAEKFYLTQIAALNIVAVECVAGPEALWHSCAPGLADGAYTHDGQLTKSVVRAATVSALQPYPGALMWDVGAGCGSVGIEWLRVVENMKAIAIEVDSARCVMIATNAANLGVPELSIIEGRVPEALINLPDPNAIFIGGGLTKKGVFDHCWQQLKPGGVLVANGVTLESEALLIDLHKKYGGELTRITVESATPMGRFRGWQQAKPVIQWRVNKSGAMK